jgi:hypothetical protein
VKPPGVRVAGKVVVIPGVTGARVPEVVPLEKLPVLVVTPSVAGAVIPGVVGFNPLGEIPVIAVVGVLVMGVAVPEKLLIPGFTKKPVPLIVLGTRV